MLDVSNGTPRLSWPIGSPPFPCTVYKDFHTSEVRRLSFLFRCLLRQDGIGGVKEWNTVNSEAKRKIVRNTALNCELDSIPPAFSQ
jgi:hypothetical protein